MSREVPDEHLWDRGPESAANGTGEAFDEIARAIKSQTEEIASLVKNHTEHNTPAQGTVKGLTRQSEELVFLVRAPTSSPGPASRGRLWRTVSCQPKWEHPQS